METGIKESDTGLAPPSQGDLVSDKQMMQEQPLQFVVGLSNEVSPIDIEEGMRVRIIGFNPYPEAKFFSDALLGYIASWPSWGIPLTQKDRTRPANGLNPTEYVLLITTAPFAAALTCIVLSIVRLVAIAGKDYGGASIDASKANVKPALIFLYA